MITWPVAVVLVAFCAWWRMWASVTKVPRPIDNQLTRGIMIT